MKSAPQKDKDKLVEEAIHYGERRDSQFTQEIFETIESLVATWAPRLCQAINAFAAVAEIVAGRPILEPQIHLRAKGKIIVHTVEDLCQRIMLAGQT